MTALTKETFSKFQDIEELSQFLHQCINDLCTENTQQQEFETARKNVQNFYRQRAIDETFPVPPELPEHIVTTLETVFKSRHADITTNYVVKKELVTNGHNLVESFDWRLKWVLGSSKLANIREPVCQVDFNCVNLGKDLKPQRNCVNFECDLEKIDELISVLGKARNELESA